MDEIEQLEKSAPMVPQSETKKDTQIEEADWDVEHENLYLVKTHSFKFLPFREEKEEEVEAEERKRQPLSGLQIFTITCYISSVILLILWMIYKVYKG